ncbi:hypothetical protein NliqN6_4133 [Naganishia liquefaciens]|uniref:Uncharacterized protein n=1 Tax=Naganishia liquefaciens TaxID=104408 RepID=A0A8H3YHK9_9TREE|nr:hypothetical protein NliqN6_4133 [Naganishia liquefaciens]
MASKQRSQKALLIRWTLLNLLRFFGVAAIGWAIGIQIALLISDGRADRESTTTDDSKNSAVPPIEYMATSIGVSSSTPVTLPVAVSASGLGGSSAQAMTAITQAHSTLTDVPLELWPTSISSSPQAISSAPILNLPPGMGALRKRGNQGATLDHISGLAASRYYADSTIPRQDGSVLFAVIHRVENCAALLVLLLGQIGWPERFLIRHLPALGVRSSGLALGCGKIWIGTEMQRHYVPTPQRIPGILLLSSGAMDTLIAVILIFRQRRKNRDKLLADRDIYLRFHIAQRLMFWTTIPAEAFYGTDTVAPPEDGQYGGNREKQSVSSPSPEYPTFMSGNIQDAERQIPGMFGERQVSLRGRNEAELDQDDDEPSEELIENTRVNALRQAQRNDYLHRHVKQVPPPPRIPSEVAVMPASIQRMVQGVKPRFLSPEAIPQIQVQPSTGSTLASSGASARFPRPDSTFSEISTGAISTRARPKSHLSQKPMDDTKLMPPRGAMRRASLSAEIIPASEREHARPLPFNENIPGIIPPVVEKEVARRSVVRFDLHRLSSASIASSSSVETILADILPAKPPKSKAGCPEAPIPTTRLFAPSVDEQEGPRKNIQNKPRDRQRDSRSRSPSRLSYLCSDGSSPDSPFADPADSSPESPFADTQEFHSPSSAVEDERQFEAKRKKRMSHLVL